MIVAALAGLLSYCGWDMYQDRQTQEARAARRVVAQADIDRRLAEAVAQFGAQAGWRESLPKFSSVLTVDLERQWLGKPIVFRGRIVDIASSSSSPGLYVVHLEEAGPMILKPLQVRLTAQRDQIDAFLGAYPEAVNGWATQATVAAIVRIDSISAHEVISDGDTELQQRGDGQLLELVSLSIPR